MTSAIRSNPTVLSVLFLALAAQIPHAQKVFYDVSADKTMTGWLLALLFAIALESAVLTFVVHGWHKFSYAFAVSSVLINVAYYDMLPDIFVSVLVSVILPAAIACYSVLLAETMSSDNLAKDGIDTNNLARNDTPNDTEDTRGSDTEKVAKSDNLAKDDNDTCHSNDTPNDTEDLAKDDSGKMAKDDSLAKMTKAQRRDMIVRLAKNGNLDIDKIVAKSGSSERTVRRDISELNGQLK